MARSCWVEDLYRLAWTVSFGYFTDLLYYGLKNPVEWTRRDLEGLPWQGEITSTVPSNEYGPQFKPVFGSLRSVSIISTSIRISRLLTKAAQPCRQCPTPLSINSPVSWQQSAEPMKIVAGESSQLNWGQGEPRDLAR